MPAVESSGTQVTVADTDHTLGAPTTSKTRVLFVDASALTTTAVLDIVIRRPILAGGTSRNVYRRSFTGASVADEPNIQSIPVSMPHGGQFIIKCSAASISIPWSIETLD